MGYRRLRTRSIRNRRQHHNYWLDPTFQASGGRYIRRLPDRTVVYTDEYKERLREYETRQAEERAERPAADEGEMLGGTWSGKVQQ